jgi:glycosyltransferase involved in cell wall biosynthesis
MKLFYFAPADIQIARVDRQAIVHFCSALKDAGVDVELVTLRIRLLDVELRADDLLDLYGVRSRFPVRAVRVPVSQESPGWWIALARFFVHATVGIRIARLSKASPLVFYTKNYLPALAFVLLRRLGTNIQLVFEAHVLPRRPLQRFVLRHSSLVVANSHALATDLADQLGLSAPRVLGTHQGVDLEAVEHARMSSAEARRRLDLPDNKKLVVYTGKIYRGYEEVDYILRAALRLRDDPSILFLLVGGRADHVETWRRTAAAMGADNVLFTGFVAPGLARQYQFAADLLLLYYPSGLEVNAYRSPGKLFDYLAAARPIIAVDLPVLREVLGK